MRLHIECMYLHFRTTPKITNTSASVASWIPDAQIFIYAAEGVGKYEEVPITQELGDLQGFRPVEGACVRFLKHRL